MVTIRTAAIAPILDKKADYIIYAPGVVLFNMNPIADRIEWLRLIDF